MTSHLPGMISGRNVLFASDQSVHRFTKGAGQVTLAMLQGLRTLGFQCHTFHAAKHGDEVRQSFERSLDSIRPDVIVMTGNAPADVVMRAVANERGVTSVFWLHRLASGMPPGWLVREIGACVSPSRFARDYYRSNFGLDSTMLPHIVDWQRVRVEDHEPTYVTFVNPTLGKGAAFVLGVARDLERRRPDIPLLIVEAAGTKRGLADSGFKPSGFSNIRFMAATRDPREFYWLTKILLVPSLVWETTGLVAVEAMINGIPVIGSDRGSLPETLGDAGITLPVSQRVLSLPTADDVGPWVDTIVKLWDDPRFYQEQSDKARAEALRWHPDRTLPLYAEFFRSVATRPGEPT